MIGGDQESGASPVVWDDEGTPRSALFDDIYYSREGGLAESGLVFLDGCGLPDAWAGQSCFVVGELGFGTGLNILALLDLWRRHRPPRGQLSVFSVEAFLMPPADARRALTAAPELADLAERLIAGWPRAAKGFHRIAFPNLGATLDLAVMDAAEALAAWAGAADAWFLDGFSPSRNPLMWSDAVIAEVARHSRPGARAATFTVAGDVRRRLQEQRFELTRMPGFGAKRERLEARMGGVSSLQGPIKTSRVAIIGAGIAGAALARAFSALGHRAVVVEAAAVGAGASGNLAALVMPRIDAGGGPIAALYAQALARAADLYDAAPGVVLSKGAALIEVEPKDASRFDRVASSDLFAAGAVERLSGSDLAESLSDSICVGGLYFRDGRVVDPARVLSAWLDDAEIIPRRVSSLEPDGDAWRLLDDDGGEITRADIVCIAAGAEIVSLAPSMPLAPVRGQVSFAPLPFDQAVIGGGYAIPAPGGVLFGATHDRGETAVDVREQDHARNLDLLRATLPDLAARIRETSLDGRASIRAATPDFLPLAGPLETPGLFVLSGLGSRGFCAAPLLAEHIAAIALGAPSPLPVELAQIVHPARFAMRRKRRLARSSHAQDK